MNRTGYFLLTLGWLLATGLVWGQDMGDSTRIKINESLDRSTVLISISNSSGANGIGSGFVATSEGWVVTNHHVVADPQFADGDILVKFKDGSVFSAQVIGDDPGNDLAVLRLTPSPGGKAVPLKLGDSHRLSVGQTVLAKGNPLGLEGTLSQGIISAIRNLKSLTGTMIEGAIQTDASIAQGNSGGPLVNALGDVVGVISAGVYNPAGGTMLNTINFAIPVNRVKDILNQVRMQGARPTPVARNSGSINRRSVAQNNPPANHPPSSDDDQYGGGVGRSAPPSRSDTQQGGYGSKSRGRSRQSTNSMGGSNLGMGGSMSGGQQSLFGNGWVYLGIDGEDYRGSRVAGVKVLDVEPNSPAARAGLRSDQTAPPSNITKRGNFSSTGHIITAVDGEKVDSVDDLTALIASKFPGDTAVLSTICCNESREEKIRVKLGWSKGGSLGSGNSNNSRSLNRDLNRMGMSNSQMGMGVSVRIIGPDGQPQDPTPPKRPPVNLSGSRPDSNAGASKPSQRPSPTVAGGNSRRLGRGAPYLGIEGEDYAEGSVRGVKIMVVANASPARIAGLRTDADRPPQRISQTCRSTGHVITRIGTEKVASLDDMEAILSRKSPGEIIDLTVLSCGGQIVETIPVRLTSK